MVPEKYRLAAIGRFLLEAFERKRPAMSAWDEAPLVAAADEELARMQLQLKELGMDDPGYWARARELMREVLVPRWIALARAENELSAKDYGMWRGGDLLARGAFALGGLVLGGFVVWAPFIPIWEKWIPWALFVGGPFIPDAYFWWYRRRYRRKLESLLGELAQAGESLEMYRPLSEVQRTLTGEAETPEAAAMRTRS